MSGAFLQIQNLSCGYGRDVVLEDITFSVRRGDLATIIGPNGTGKTTLLKTIPGLIRPVRGQVLMEGESVPDMPGQVRAGKIAMVMQTLESIHMTVEEYVLLGRLPYFRPYQFFEDRADREAADTYMAFTHILHLRKAPLSRISSGERQLAGIAKALVQEPDLLLMDEPTAHLDISHQARIMDRVAEMKNRYGLTVIMVQHDLNLASEYSDQVVLLDKQEKRLFCCGTPGEVITRDNIRAVYRTDVAVAPHPHSGRPGIFIQRQDERQSR